MFVFFAFSLTVFLASKNKNIMYVNEKMRSVETIPGMGAGRDKREQWRV
jgi:hypothetical protein